MENSTRIMMKPTLAIICTLFLATGAAHAQSSDGIIGGILGGTIGSVIGGELDNKGSSSDGKVVGALIGGSLGYIVGDGLNDDDRLRKQYNSRPGSYYNHNGRSYRRYRDDQYGYVYIQISSDDPYYYNDGRRKNASNYSDRNRQSPRNNRRYRY